MMYQSCFIRNRGNKQISCQVLVRIIGLHTWSLNPFFEITPKSLYSLCVDFFRSHNIFWLVDDKMFVANWCFCTLAKHNCILLNPVLCTFLSKEEVSCCFYYHQWDRFWRQQTFVCLTSQFNQTSTIVLIHGPCWTYDVELVFRRFPLQLLRHQKSPGSETMYLSLPSKMTDSLPMFLKKCLSIPTLPCGPIYGWGSG